MLSIVHYEKMLISLINTYKPLRREITKRVLCQVQKEKKGKLIVISFLSPLCWSLLSSLHKKPLKMPWKRILLSQVEIGWNTLRLFSNWEKIPPPLGRNIPSSSSMFNNSNINRYTEFYGNSLRDFLSPPLVASMLLELLKCSKL